MRSINDYYLIPYAAGILFILSIVLMVIFGTGPSRPFYSYVNGHIVLDTTTLDSYYVSYGGPALVSYAASSTAPLTMTSYHATGHAVGEVLYRHEQLGAVATCGDSFEWGCLHQVIGRALAESGPEAMDRLAAQCASYADLRERGHCQHGLGHGLMFVANYDESKLSHLMDVCDSITTIRPLPTNESCHAGLMMEFNMHYMTMEYAGKNGRPADAAHAFSVCDRLDTPAHKKMCIWWAVSWLHGQFYNFQYSAIAFRGLGDLCRQLDDADLRTTCFESVGRSIGVDAILPSTQALGLCRSASIDSDAVRSCIGMAARVYTSEGNGVVGNALCALVAEDPALMCRGSKDSLY